MSIQTDTSTLSAKQERVWFRAWTLALVLFFVIAGGGAIVFQWRVRTLQNDRMSRTLSPEAADPGVTEAETLVTDGATRVNVGFYIERIPELSIPEASWTVIFDLWFRWQGNDLQLLDRLVVMEGTIESRELLAEYTEGDLHYERYRIVAKITKPFDVELIPLDRHLLVLAIEDGERTRDQLLFVPDTENSSISSRVRLSGFRIDSWKAIEKAHSYKTTRGDPRLRPGSKSTHSQCRVGITIRRDTWGLYIKMFQALHISVTIAFLACFIKPTDVDPRFGLGVGALFAAVANSYLVNSLVPDTGELTLADIVNGLGILTILVTLIESTISLYLYDQCGEVELSKRLDRVSFKILVAGFVMANAAVLVLSLG